MKKITILGAGESGVGAARLAQKQGYEVWVSELKTIPSKYKEMLEQHSIPYEEGKHTEARILSSEIVIRSPGIPNEVSILRQIREQGIRVLSEIEFGYLHRNKNCKIIAITGSNGKTTTTTMIYELLKYEGFDVGLAGNIGYSFAEMIAFHPHEWYVLEISSFQLEDCYDFHPYIAIITNLSANHLDRYQYKFSAYADAKFRLLKNQTESDYFIYCKDSPDLVRELERINIRSKKIPFGMKNDNENYAWMDNSEIIITMSDKNTSKNKADFSRIATESQKVKGPHNAYNSMAAGITGSLLEIRKESIRNVLTEFEGIEHRLEFVANVKNVEFYNDSKATTANAAWYALNSTTGPTIWIAGGVDKGNDYGILLDIVKSKVKALIVFGKDRAKIKEAFENNVSLLFDVPTLEEAFQKALEVASEGNVVLLSPACASFDLFENYEQRGNLFKSLVQNYILTVAPETIASQTEVQ
jgi:UDP-N-acetylmuramoylalanine--D-glutamate ligase